MCTVATALNMTVFVFLNASVKRSSCVCMKRVLKRVDSCFSRFQHSQSNRVPGNLCETRFLRDFSEVFKIKK